MRNYKYLWFLTLSMMACTGCSRAPAIEIIGSFLPSWMFCIAAAVVVTGVTRWQLVRRDLERNIPALAILYPSLAVALSCIFWLILFS